MIAKTDAATTFDAGHRGVPALHRRTGRSCSGTRSGAACWQPLDGEGRAVSERTAAPSPARRTVGRTTRRSAGGPRAERRAERQADAGERRADPRRRNNRAWFLVLPVVVSSPSRAVIPLMTVVNFSVQDIFSPDDRHLRGPGVVQDGRPRSRDAGRVRAARCCSRPRCCCWRSPSGWRSRWRCRGAGSGCRSPGHRRAAAAHPVERGGHHLADLRPRRHRAGRLGDQQRRWASTSTTPPDSTDAWITVLVMDVWHWTPLVALLATRACAPIPEPVLPGGADRRRLGLGHLPPHPVARLRGVLTIAILLRFMDSFMIYTEPFVRHRRRAGQRHLVPEPVPAVEDRGRASSTWGRPAAFSLLYFLVVLLVSLRLLHRD